MDVVKRNHKTNGQFSKGNTYARPGPHYSRVQSLRTLILEATGDEEVLAIWANLLAIAQDPTHKESLKASMYVLERLLGPPVGSDVQDKLEMLESMVVQFMSSRGQELPAELRLNNAGAA